MLGDTWAHIAPGVGEYRWLGLHGMRLTTVSEEEVAIVLEVCGGKVLYVDRTRDGGRTYCVRRNR
jgi:hypothetical protein